MVSVCRSMRIWKPAGDTCFPALGGVSGFHSPWPGRRPAAQKCLGRSASGVAQDCRDVLPPGSGGEGPRLRCGRAALPPGLQGGACPASPGSWWPRVPWPLHSSRQGVLICPLHISIRVSSVCQAPSLSLRNVYGLIAPAGPCAVCPAPRELSVHSSGTLCTWFPLLERELSTSVQPAAPVGLGTRAMAPVSWCPSHRVFRISTEEPPEGEEKGWWTLWQPPWGHRGHPEGSPASLGRAGPGNLESPSVRFGTVSICSQPARGPGTCWNTGMTCHAPPGAGTAPPAPSQGPRQQLLVWGTPVLTLVGPRGRPSR